MGAYRAIDELDGYEFLNRRLRVTSAYKRRFTTPPKSCKSVRIKAPLPMGTTQEDVEKVISKQVGLCYVRMGRKKNTCVVDLVTHSQMLALLQLRVRIGTKLLRIKYAPNQGGRYMNPIYAQRERVVTVEPIPPRITEEELLKEMKQQLKGVEYVVIIPGVKTRKAYVIFELPYSIEKSLQKKVVNIRGREANIIKWQPLQKFEREKKPPTKVFGCRINKLPKKLTKKRFLDLAAKLIGKGEFSLIWELNPKRKRFSGTVELIFELLEDARFAKAAFEEFVVPGTCTGLKVFISERQSDGLWTKKIEDLYEIRGIPRPTENTKKRSLQDEEESCSKRVRQDDSIEMGQEQEQLRNSDSSNSEKSEDDSCEVGAEQEQPKNLEASTSENTENSKKRLLQEGDEAPAAKRVKQGETEDKQEKSNLEGKKDLSESWPEEETAEKQVKDEHATTITEQEPEEESAEKQVKEEQAKMLTEQKPSETPGKEAPG